MENAHKRPESYHDASEHGKIVRPKFDGATGLRDLLVHELRSMYFIEKMLIRSFPKMIKNACNYELIEAITIHLAETKKQIIRIEDTFVALDENPILERCKAIEWMLQDIDDIVEVTKFGIVRDAGIVLTLHRIEHYEIASYSILATYAENLHEYGIHNLLAESLNEEKLAELRLTKIAQTIQFYTESTQP